MCIKCNSKISLKAVLCGSCSQTKLRLKQWKTEKYRNKFCDVYLKGRHLIKNKQEKIIHRLIGSQYRFNNKTKIFGFIPDFIDDKNKKIIEFFGDYWHRDEKREKKRLKYYKQKGYKTLIIWESELNDNIDYVFAKILDFNGGY